MVHGDDFTFTGYDEDLDFIEGIMKDEYEIKVRGRLGAGKNEYSRKSIGIRKLGCLLKSGPSASEVDCRAFWL